MCFHLHHNNREVKTAEKDIICIKGGHIAKSGFIPYYQDHFTYRVNKSQKPIELSVQYGEIEAGYHAFTTILFDQRSVTNGKLGLFVIPKGSSYYYNPNRREVVASNMIYKGWLRSYKTFNYYKRTYNKKLLKQLLSDTQYTTIDKIELPNNY